MRGARGVRKVHGQVHGLFLAGSGTGGARGARPGGRTASYGGLPGAREGARAVHSQGARFPLSLDRGIRALVGGAHRALRPRTLPPASREPPAIPTAGRPRRARPCARAHRSRPDPFTHQSKPTPRSPDVQIPPLQARGRQEPHRPPRPRPRAAHVCCSVDRRMGEGPTDPVRAARCTRGPALLELGRRGRGRSRRSVRSPCADRRSGPSCCPFPGGRRPHPPEPPAPESPGPLTEISQKPGALDPQSGEIGPSSLVRGLSGGRCHTECHSEAPGSASSDHQPTDSAPWTHPRRST